MWRAEKVTNLESPRFLHLNLAFQLPIHYNTNRVETPSKPNTTTTASGQGSTLLTELPIPQSVENSKLLSMGVLRSQLLRLAQKGLKASEAAKVVGCSAATAQFHYRDVGFRKDVLSRIEAAFGDVDAAYAAKRKSLHEMIEEQAYSSFEQLVLLLRDPDLHPSLQVKIHQDFLDRSEESAAFAPKGVGLEAADLARASATAREMDNVLTMRRVK